MKKLPILLACLLCQTISFAQYDAPSWHYVIDAYNDADLSDLEVDNEGNTYVTLNYMGSLNLEGYSGKPLPHAPHQHGLLMKLNAQGKLVWCRAFQSAFDNRINDLTLGPDGDVYITGFGDGLMHFPGKGSDIIKGREKAEGEYHQPQGIYIARYSKDGDLRWVNYWAATWGEGKSIAVNSKGEVAWSYYHYSALKDGEKILDPFERVYQVKEAKVSLAQFNANGELQSIRTIQELESESDARIHRVKYDAFDHLIVYGQFKKELILSEEHILRNDGYYESYDAYIARYTPDMKLLWVKQLGGKNYQNVEDLTTDAEGRIYATGQYSHECILMDGIRSARKSDYEWKSGNSFFYLQVYPDGETNFIRYEEGRGYNGTFIGSSIDIDVNDDVHILGAFSDTLQLDGIEIKGLTYPNSSYTSTWKENEILQLDVVGKVDKSWLSGNRIRSGNSHYAISALYYGEDAQVTIGGRDVKLPSKDYGRCSVVFGGSVRRTKPISLEEEILADVRQTQRLERLQSLEALFSCPGPSGDLAEPSGIWHLIGSPEEANDEIAGFTPAELSSPCGIQLENLEASLYPNPASGPVNLQLKGMEGRYTRIDVFTEQGQSVFSQYIQVPSNDYIQILDLSNAATGTYFVRITHESFAKAIRLVKVKI